MGKYDTYIKKWRKDDNVTNTANHKVNDLLAIYNSYNVINVYLRLTTCCYIKFNVVSLSAIPQNGKYYRINNNNLYYVDVCSAVRLVNV